MQYRRELIPRPLSITHQPVGARLPRVTTARVPFRHDRRLFSIERHAPENASEAVDGLGVWDNRSIKARSLNHGIGAKMPYVGTTPIRRPNIQLSAVPVSRVRKGVPFRVFNLQGLGDGPVPGTNNPGFWSEINSALSSTQVNALVNAGANFYVNRETGKHNLSIANAQAKTAALQAQLAKSNAALTSGASSTPSWVIPAVAVGGVAVVGLLFFASRRK